MVNFLPGLGTGEMLHSEDIGNPRHHSERNTEKQEEDG